MTYWKEIVERNNGKKEKQGYKKPKGIKNDRDIKIGMSLITVIIVLYVAILICVLYV